MILYDYSTEQIEQIKRLSSPNAMLTFEQRSVVSFANKMVNSPRQITKSEEDIR